MDSWPQSGKGSVKNTCMLTKRDMLTSLIYSLYVMHIDCDIVKVKGVTDLLLLLFTSKNKCSSKSKNVLPLHIHLIIRNNTDKSVKFSCFSKPV